MLDRRSAILTISAAATLAASNPLLAQTGRKRLLVLGGTNYVGPHIVHGALLAGHDVTLFNRGITNAELFPEIEKIRGDRTRGEDGLNALANGREWDIVIDTWLGHPRAVYESARLLAGRTSSYVYISSIAVYGGFRRIGLTEADSILSLDRAPSLESPDVGYVWAKRLGEAAVSEFFPENGIVVRGSSIFGYDYSRLPTNQNVYWPLRIRAGGDVAVPDDPTAMVQWSDAAALADLAIALGSAGQSARVNAVYEPISFRAFIEKVQSVANPDANLVWVPREIMQANGGIPFETVPLWIPADDPEPGFYRFDHRSAREAGLRQTDLEDTVWHVLKTYRNTPVHYQPAWAASQGMPADVEANILAAFRSSTA